MNKHFTYKSDKQLWRILISDNDKLLLETRNTETKEVYFHCFDLITGVEIFSNLQLEEKQWIGIETVYKDIIYFHRFPKPDLPGHKEIIAFDIASQKIIWTNTEYSFQFIYNDKIYCFVQGFEDRTYFAIDYLSGGLIEELGSNYSMINNLRSEADQYKDWSRYIYPVRISESENEAEKKLIETKTEKLQLAGEIEFNLYKNMLMFNYHEKNKGGTYTNKFQIIDVESAKTIFESDLNQNVSNLFTDSFFIYKEFLFLLRGKHAVDVYYLD